MKKVLLLTVLLSLQCLPSSSGSVPDPRLGTLVLQIDEVSANASDGSAKFINGLIATDSQGGVHIVGTLKPTRVYGTTDVHFNKSQYWHVTRDGKTELKPGPSYSATTVTNSNLTLRLGLDDELPVLVQTAGLATGRVMAFYSFDGTAWNEKTLFFSNLPHAVTVTKFDNDLSQVRALGHGEFVVQLQNHLLHSTATGWQDLNLPAGAREIRMVNADATSLRVMWVEDNNTLATGTYARSTWTVDATVARAKQQSGPAFDARFSVAGNVTAFVADVGDTTWRFSGNELRVVGTATTHVPLVLTSHPLRALRGMTQGVYLGKDTGVASELVSGPHAAACNNPAPPVVLDSQGKPETGNPFPDSTEVRTCVDRVVDVQVVPEVDLSGVVLVTFDRKQDAVLRAYVKHVPFAVPADPFFGTGDAGVAGFPGDDGSSDLDGPILMKPSITGQVLGLGLSDQSVLSVELTSVADASMTQHPMVAADGTFRSQPLANGDWKVAFTGTGFTGKTLIVNVPGELPKDVGITVLEGTFTTRPVPWKVGETLLGVDSALNFYQLGVGSIRQGNPVNNVSTLITDRADPSPRPIFELDPQGAPLIGWRQGVAVLYRTANGNTSGYTGASLTEYRAVGQQLPAVASGTVDGLSPRNWKWQSDLVFIAGALDLAVFAPSSACAGMAAWFSEDGGTTARWSGTCSGVNMTVVNGPIPQPPLTVVTNDNGAMAYEGAQCGKKGGYVTPCPLFVVNAGDSHKISDTVVDILGDVYLERSGTTGTLKRFNFTTFTSDVLIGNMTLPTTYVNDERPFYQLRTSNFAVRTSTGFSFHSSSIQSMPVPASIVRSFSIPTGLAFFTSPNSDCSRGCGLESLESTPTDPVRKTLITSGADGREQVGTIGTAWVVAVGERTWSQCPGGPCQYLEFSTAGAERQPINRGTLISYPPLTRYKPLLMSLVNPDGGVAIPSTL